MKQTEKRVFVVEYSFIAEVEAETAKDAEAQILKSDPEAEVHHVYEK
jgi:hypothetical protein